MYSDKPVKGYIKELSQGNPVPGGGSAAALTACLGAGLNSMVAAYSLNQKKPESRRRIRELRRQNEILLKKMNRIVDADCRIYLQLNATLKSAPSAKRTVLLQKCFKQAADVPFKLCHQTEEAVDICHKVTGLANKLLLSDCANAIVFLQAAAEAGAVNVRVNLKYIKDPGFVKNRNKELGRILKKISRLRQEIIRKVEGQL